MDRDNVVGFLLSRCHGCSSAGAVVLRRVQSVLAAHLRIRSQTLIFDDDDDQLNRERHRDLNNKLFLKKINLKISCELERLTRA